MEDVNALEVTAADAEAWDAAVTSFRKAHRIGSPKPVLASETGSVKVQPLYPPSDLKEDLGSLASLRFREP